MSVLILPLYLWKLLNTGKKSPTLGLNLCGKLETNNAGVNDGNLRSLGLSWQNINLIENYVYIAGNVDLVVIVPTARREPVVELIAKVKSALFIGG